MLEQGTLPFGVMTTDRGHIITAQAIDQIREQNRRVPITGADLARAFGFDNTKAIRTDNGSVLRGTLLPLDLKEARALFEQSKRQGMKWNTDITTWDGHNAAPALSMVPPGTTGGVQ